MLQTLIYHSTPIDIRREDIGSILEASERNNAARDVTGMLIFNDEHFVQVLEGGRAAVGDTFARIMADRRHRDIRLVAVRDIRERTFWEWRMRYVPAIGGDRAALLRYGESSRFDPSAMTAEALVTLCLVWGRRAAA